MKKKGEKREKRRDVKEMKREEIRKREEKQTIERVRVHVCVRIERGRE